MTSRNLRHQRSIVVGAMATAFAASVAVTGCSTSASRSNTPDYRTSQSVPALELPPDLKSNNPSTTRVNPGTTQDATSQRVSARQQAVLPQFDSIALNRDGDDRWLTVNGAADLVWPQVVDFFEKDGLEIITKNPQTGIIETGWLENLAEVKTTLQRLFRRVFGKILVADSYDKFRVRVDRGAQPGTTEVFLSHRRLDAKDVPGENQKDVVTVRWEAGERQPDLEVEMLRLLMLHLGEEEEKAKQIASSPQETVEREIVSRREDENGVSRLVLEEEFSRAWRRVGITLDRIGFTIEDRDRSQGIYYLRSVDPEAAKKQSDSNFVTRIFTRQKQVEFTSKIYVAELDNVTEVTVATDGEDVEETNKRIIDLLYEEMN